MASEAPDVCIILVNWNGWEDTLECIRSLKELQYPNYSITVVDNNSSDESVEKLKAHTKDVIIVESKTNRGFSGGNNVGILERIEPEVDYVWLLNNDTVVDKNALSALVERMETDSDIGICGSKLIYYYNRDTLQALGGGTYNKWLGITKNIGQGQPIDFKFERERVEQKLDFIVGASMLASTEFIHHVGLLNEDYFLYYEELDWVMRAKGAFKLGFAPESMVYHKEGAATGASDLQLSKKSLLADYHQLRNRLRFTRQYFPLYLPSVYMTMVAAIGNRILRGQWNRIPMIIKLMFNLDK